MEVAVPLTMTPEFSIHGARAFPYASAPSSPSGEPFNYHYHFTSAPTSPNRAASIYSQITEWANPNPDPLIIDDDEGCDLFDFAFQSGRQYGSDGFQLPEITTADKLFEKGRIRTLQECGRSLSANSSRSGRRESRSLSPPRRDDGLPLMNTTTSPENPAKGGATRKWPRLKDLLLFRSASEGRVTGRGSKDPLLKYTLLSHVSFSNKKKSGEDKKTGGGESVRRGYGPAVTAVSAHERHYTACRAAAEEQRKKTPLPFQRQGLLGFIAIRGKNKGGGNANSSSLSKGKF